MLPEASLEAHQFRIHIVPQSCPPLVRQSEGRQSAGRAKPSRSHVECGGLRRRPYPFLLQSPPGELFESAPSELFESFDLL